MSFPGEVTDGVRGACRNSCGEETGRQLSLFVSEGEREATAAEAATHQLLGLGEGVLHVGEAEAGHGDELAHHRHKLVSQLLRPLLLVIQLLEADQQGGEG